MMSTLKRIRLIILLLGIFPLTSLTSNTAGAGNNGAGSEKYHVFTTHNSPESPPPPPSPVEVTATLGTPLGEYPSLKDAFDMINLGIHNGDIEIKINESLTETESAVLNARGDGSADYISVHLYPTATGLTITGNLAMPLIDLNGADLVTIDGRVNGVGSLYDMTISNASTSAAAGTSVIRFINDATSNMVAYCIINGSSASATDGTITFSTTAGTSGNDDNSITHCVISDGSPGVPVTAVFSEGTAGKENSGNTVFYCYIFNFAKYGVFSVIQ
jgi:hypothetical protein